MGGIQARLRVQRREQEIERKASMQGNPKTSNAAVRSAERRRREGEAPRLLREVPNLKSLRIEIVEHLSTGTSKHVKLVVVAHAPALFDIPCGDPDCQDGGHDLTRTLLGSLRAREREASGASDCQGSVRNVNCNRRITYLMKAEYV